MIRQGQHKVKEKKLGNRTLSNLESFLWLGDEKQKATYKIAFHRKRAEGVLNNCSKKNLEFSGNVSYSNPSVCTTLDLYEFDLYELFLLTKTFDLYECHSICTSFSLFLGRFFWQFGKILTFEGKMLKNWNDWNQLLKVFRLILEIDWILI